MRLQKYRRVIGESAMPGIRISPFVALRSTRHDEGERQLIFVFETESGAEYEYRIPYGLLPAILLSVMTRMQDLASQENRSSEEQAFELRDLAPLSQPDGKLGFRLALDGNLRLSLIVDQPGIEAMRRALSGYDALAEAQKPSHPVH